MSKATTAARLVLLSLLVISMMPASALGDPVYQYELQFGAFGTGNGQFWYPDGVGVAPWGDVWVSDSDYGRVQRFTQDGTFGNVVLNTTQPTGMAWGNNALYIADQGFGRVLIMDAQGTQTFGQLGTGTLGPGDGEFDSPNGIALDRFGNVYVTDAYNRVQKFDSEGTFLLSWGTPGSDNGEFNRATGVAVGLDDYVYVSDLLNQRIQKFTLDGTYVSQWPSEGSALSMDGAGDLFCSEYANQRVVKYDSVGTVLASFGTSGTAPGEFSFRGPTGVAADAWRRVYVGDPGLITVSAPGVPRVQRFFAPSPTELTRIAGLNRFATAVGASKQAYPRGLSVDPEGFKTVVIATAYDFPDALGGAALAGTLDAPVLLVKPDEVPAEVQLEIIRLGATRAIILGGTRAVSTAVETLLSQKVSGIVRVDRIAGATRYETADSIAREVKRIRGADFDGVAFLATGLDFPDALAASPIAARNGEPIFLTDPRGMSKGTMAAMAEVGVTHALILGGTAALSKTVGQQAASIARSVDRFEGDNRYDTAVAVARYGVSDGGLTWARTGLATGQDFPDALAGGVMQGRYRSVLLLTERDKLPTSVSAELRAERDGIYELTVFGGDTVISKTVNSATTSLLH